MDLRTLAAQLDLSITTVSRALANYPDVSAKTKERVRTAAAAAGYLPNRAAQRLKTGRADAIGLVLPTGSRAYGDAFFAELISAIGSALAERDLDLVITATRAGEDEVSGIRRLVEGGRVDGLIVPRTLWHDPRVDYLLEKRIPFVTHGRTARAAEHAWHDVDGEAAIAEAVARLAGFGHRQIGFINAPMAYAYARYRLAGFEAGMAQAGIGILPGHVRTAAPDPGSAESEARALLGQPAAPTAIICATDRIAYGTLAAIKALDLVPGHDVSVIGYDDLMASAHQTPPLTTMRQSIRSEGTALVAALVGMIAGKPLHAHQDLARATLVPRQSDGPWRKRSSGDED
jgi:LacI family transcriptional regulator